MRSTCSPCATGAWRSSTTSCAPAASRAGPGAGPQLNKPHPPSLSPAALAAAGWTAFIGAGLLFLAIAWNVAGRSALAALDAGIADWLHAQATPALTGVFLAITHLNSLAAILGLFVAIQALAMLLLVPGWVFPLVAGAVFGFGWGLLAAMAGALLAALAAFMLARTVLRKAHPRHDLPALLRHGGAEGGALNWTLFAGGVAATVLLTVALGRMLKSRVPFSVNGPLVAPCRVRKEPHP